MTVKMFFKEVGPWPMNTYLVICEETAKSVIIDPGADPEVILRLAKDTQIEKILITHAHDDHIQALEEIQLSTGAPVYLHPADAVEFNLLYDLPITDGDTISIGNQKLRAIHTPGHTPGSTSFDIGKGRIIVGDTLFVGGPGHTETPEDFSITIRTMREVVFTWPDETRFFPGHGPSGRIGLERPTFDDFVIRGWPADLHGDVTWSE